jgi:hypothetical protein
MTNGDGPYKIADYEKINKESLIFELIIENTKRKGCLNGGSITFYEKKAYKTSKAPRLEHESHDC